MKAQLADIVQSAGRAFFNIFMGGALWGLQEQAYIVYNSMEIIINSFKGVEYE